jgi:hypothetical protein
MSSRKFRVQQQPTDRHYYNIIHYASCDSNIYIYVSMLRTLRAAVYFCTYNIRTVYTHTHTQASGFLVLPGEKKKDCYMCAVGRVQ